MVTASLNNYRQSPRKVRLVASLIKGKSAVQALDFLGVTVKRASDPLAKLLQSAIANAKNLGIAEEGLYIKECRVDSGMTMKRMMPGSRGSGFPIHKKTSSVRLVLDTRAVKAPKVKKAKPASVKTK
jgi:large subunit ribosomal protein L22